jgi:hypothetical protein
MRSRLLGRERPGGASPAGPLLSESYLRLTVTGKCAVAVFATASVAVQVTVVRPILKRLPECGLHVTGTEPAPGSDAVTVYLTATRLACFGALTVIAFAPLITGGVVSNV